jgi:flavin reductase (DIM6/NTAB) family NADH-FMN oxidoreductase RutF
MEISFEAVSARERYKILTGLVVPRPIAFVSTVSVEGRYNAAPFSFFNLMAVSPPTVIVGINLRDGVKKDSLVNIEQTGEFVLNIVSESIAQAMNLCSIEASPDFDEICFAGLTPVPGVMVKAPRIAEAPAHLECRLSQLVTIAPGRQLVIGTVVHARVDDNLVDPGYSIDQQKLEAIGRMGGTLYARTGNLFSMARPDTEGLLAAQAAQKNK